MTDHKQTSGEQWDSRRHPPSGGGGGDPPDWRGRDFSIDPNAVKEALLELAEGQAVMLRDHRALCDQVARQHSDVTRLRGEVAEVKGVVIRLDHVTSGMAARVGRLDQEREISREQLAAVEKDVERVKRTRAREAEQRAQHRARVDSRIDNLERTVAKATTEIAELDRDVEQTGRHQAVRAALDESSSKWRWWALGIAAALLVSGCSVGLGYLVRRLEAPVGAQEKKL